MADEDKTEKQKRGIVITVVVLAIIVLIGFISAFLRQWK
jgi:hypothetical protein